MLVADSHFYGNVASDGFGGAIAVDSQNLVMRNTSLADNHVS